MKHKAGTYIKVVASDLDGTILRQGEQKVREEFFPLIRSLKEKGIAFVAASGRQYPNLRRLMEPVAEEISFISENGALVVSRGKVVYTSPMDRTLVQELTGDLEKVPGTEILVSTPETYYALQGREGFVRFLRETMHVRVKEAESFAALQEDILKVSIWWESGIPEEMEKAFHVKYDGRLQIVDGGNGWLDFNNLGTSKGKAIAVLAEEEGFSLEDTVSFGDSENDMEMLKRTGYSYAMDTAREHVKQSARAICQDVLPVMMEYMKECV